MERDLIKTYFALFVIALSHFLSLSFLTSLLFNFFSVKKRDYV